MGRGAEGGRVGERRKAKIDAGVALTCALLKSVARFPTRHPLVTALALGAATAFGVTADGDGCTIYDDMIEACVMTVPGAGTLEGGLVAGAGTAVLAAAGLQAGKFFEKRHRSARAAAHSDEDER